MKRRRIGFGTVLVVLVLGMTSGPPAVARPATARGASNGGATSLASVAADVERVRIVDFAFRGRTLTVPKGTRVRWVNTGSVAHSSTSNTDKWDSGIIATGDSFSRVFRRAGNFRYHCSIHPTTMKGKIVVQ